MKTTCVHSCKEVCNALEVAEKYEREAIREYKQFAEKCDYLRLWCETEFSLKLLPRQLDNLLLGTNGE